MQHLWQCEIINNPNRWEVRSLENTQGVNHSFWVTTCALVMGPAQQQTTNFNFINWAPSFSQVPKVLRDRKKVCGPETICFGFAWQQEHVTWGAGTCLPKHNPQGHDSSDSLRRKTCVHSCKAWGDNPFDIKTQRLLGVKYITKVFMQKLHS